MAARSLAGRAVVAVALMIGFYLFALAIAAVLLWIPWAEWRYAGRIHLQILLGCGLAGCSVLYALVPRRDAFEPPGPRLEGREHPALFGALERIAARVGQSLPREVYLVPDLNAWVANRGGLMGFGSHRVMGIGLPLLQVVDVPGFEAILAHEFGHYHGGDTKLGPWIYKTRAAIGRTLEALQKRSWLQLPFQWYGNFFLRITQAISRAQELTADRLAASVCGSGALARGLRAVHAYGGPFSAYWQSEVVPVLRAGFHAPLAAGFAEFVRAPQIDELARKELENALRVKKTLSFDSHPPLRERIAALGVSAEKIDGSSDGPPAVSLLDDVAAVEQSLLVFLAGKEARFERIAWPDVPTQVFLPSWRQMRESLRATLRGVTWENLAEELRVRGPGLGREIYERADDVPQQEVGRALRGPIGACLVATLVERDWQLTSGLGEPVLLTKAGGRLEPFAVVDQLLGDPAAAARFGAVMEAEALATTPVAGA